MQTKSKFQGKPLVEVPKAIPYVDFLGKDFGREVDQEARSRHPNLPNISNINYQDGVVQGSNPFYVVAVNEVLRQEGLRTATQADLEKAIRLGVLDLNSYEDSALVLRSEGDSYQPNDHLSRSLHKQVKARDPKAKYPVMIPLREDSEIIYAPILTKDGNFTMRDIDEKTGLPSKLINSECLEISTKQDGLSRLIWGCGWKYYLSSNGDNLGRSRSDGRVVVVRDPVAPEYLDAYIAKLKQKYKELKKKH